MFKRGAKNDAGVFNARIGVWNGKKSVFTHRNPKNGKVYGEDLPEPGNSYQLGRWVPAEEVVFID